jgi:hypothetical protein
MRAKVVKKSCRLSVVGCRKLLGAYAAFPPERCHPREGGDPLANREILQECFKEPPYKARGPHSRFRGNDRKPRRGDKYNSLMLLC